MKALVCSQLSDDLSGVSIEPVEIGEPGAGEVRIAVRAAAVNFPDVLMTRGLYQFRPDLPFTPGMEVAGVVEAIGPGVEGLAVGDEVTAATRLGGFAEAVVVPARAVRPRPEPFDMAEAAAFGATALTAWVGLVRRARLEARETLVVLGAGGGVGLACVQLGVHLGARVVAVASSPDKRAAALAAGAEVALDPAHGFREAVKAMTGGAGADVIIDPVGGDAFDEAVRCIAFDGRLVVAGFASGRIAQVSTNLPLIKGFSIVGLRAGEYGRRFPDRGREDLDAIHALAARGLMRPHVGARLPLERGVEALRLLAERRAVGKVVIEP